MGNDSLPIGAKPRRGRPRQQNNPPQQADPRENQIRQPVEDSGGEFGDGTTLSKDWRLIQQIICEVIKQSGEECWALVLTRLLQAVFNLSQGGNELNYKTAGGINGVSEAMEESPSP